MNRENPNPATPSEGVDPRVQDLLRRTFAAHDDVAPHRASELMERAVGGGSGAHLTARRRGGRRPGAWVAGAAAASLLVLGLVVGGVGRDRGEQLEVPSVPAAPAGTTMPADPTIVGGVTEPAPRRMTTEETAALWADLDRGIREAGTVQTLLEYRPSPASPTPPGTAVPPGSLNPSGSPGTAAPGLPDGPPAVEVEVDLRDSARPRARYAAVPPTGGSGSEALTSTLDARAVFVGDQSWVPQVMEPVEPPSGGPSTPVMRPTPLWQRESGVPRSLYTAFAFFWFVQAQDVGWDLGTGRVDGVEARHVRVVSGKDDMGKAQPATPRPKDGRAVLDLWVAVDSGRVLVAAMEHHYDTLEARRIVYGGGVGAIEPPPAGQIAPDPVPSPLPPTSSLAPSATAPSTAHG